MKKSKNRIETIDFKEFCSGGSPAYVKAREKIKNLHLGHRNFAQSGESNFGPDNLHNFGEIKKERPMLNIDRPNSFKAYSIYMNPLALIDPTFILIASSILLVAFLEKQLAKNGLISIASVLSGFLYIAFPLVAAGSLLYLISHSSFLFF